MLNFSACLTVLCTRSESTWLQLMLVASGDQAPSEYSLDVIHMASISYQLVKCVQYGVDHTWQ